MGVNTIYSNNIWRYLSVISSLLLLLACQTPPVPSPSAPGISTELPPPAEGPLATTTAPTASTTVPETDPALNPAPAPVREPTSDTVAIPTEGAAVEKPPEDVWQRMRDDMRWQQTDDIRIDKAREGYLRHVNHIPLVAGQADNYLYYVLEEVQKRNMPVELALIPMVESDWDPFAASYAGAAGLWQIMPATGTHLGLAQDSWYDGRMSVRDSTKVALDYLEELYHQFDEDWFLALAAYNSGAGNIARARKANEAQGLNTDYWSLKLRRQASNYVPKVIALAQIVAQPERYEVELPVVENAPSFEVVEIGRQLQLSKAAELAGVDVETLRALNPGQLRETLSPRQPFELLVPAENANHFEANISTLSPEELVQWRTYRIKPGDSLSRIAREFDIDVEVLQDINSIEGSEIKAGDVLKIPGGSNEGAPPRGYMVRAGDSLSRIAGKFNVSVDDIINWNALDPSAYLKPGQELKLYVNEG